MSAAEENGKKLKSCNKVDEAVRGPIFAMGMAKPVGQDAVFRHAIQYAVGADNRSIGRARQDQDTDQNNKKMKNDS